MRLYYKVDDRPKIDVFNLLGTLIITGFTFGLINGLVQYCISYYNLIVSCT